MKKLFTLAFLFLYTILNAQTTADSMIATRHDAFINNTWFGIDSTVFNRNADGFKTSSLTIKTDTSTNWKNWYKYTFNMNAANKLTEQIRENWNGTTWVNYNRYSYIYDANENVIQVLYQVWNGSTWVNAGKIEYAGYNAAGNFFTETISAWNGTAWIFSTQKEKTYYPNNTQVETDGRYLWNNSSWKKIERFAYTYNQDSIASMLHSLPDSSGANWSNDYKILNTYTTTSPMLLTESKKQIWDTIPAIPVFRDTNRTTYYYTLANKIDNTLSERSGGNNVWASQFLSQYVYNTSNELIEYYDQWNVNNVWENNTRKTYTNTSGLVSEEIQYTGSGSAWNTSKKTAYQYDANSNIIFKQIENYNGSAFTPSTRDFYYYGNFPVGLTSYTTNTLQATVYPNPVNHFINIYFVSTNNGTVKMYLVDVLGRTRLVTQQPIFVGKNNVKNSTENLEAGTYILYIINNEGKMFSQKIVVEK